MKNKLFDKKELLDSDFHPGLFKLLVRRNAALEKNVEVNSYGVYVIR